VDYGALLKGNDSGTAVQSGSPAAKAGLKEGDVVLEVDGTKINDSHSLAYLVQQHNVGDVITLKVQRGKDVITLTATLVERPAS